MTNAITYLKNNIIYTEGETSAEIKSKYFIETKDVTFFENSMELFSDKKTIIRDNHNLYSVSNFRYYIEDEFLKGENILINSNYKKAKSDKYYFADGMINLKEQNFLASDTQINLHKNIFENQERS